MIKSLSICQKKKERKEKKKKKKGKKKKKKEGARKQSLIKGTKNQVSKQIKCFRCMRDRVATV